MPEDVVIHIVDDEEPVRKSLAFLLTMSGHVARVHDSASAFLQAASGLRKEVVHQPEADVEPHLLQLGVHLVVCVCGAFQPTLCGRLLVRKKSPGS